MLKQLFYKIKWRILRPQAFAAYRQLVENEKRLLIDLEAQQELARQQIVRQAYERSPFYREYYSVAGFKLEDIGKPGWFERLPILTKEHLREHFDRIFMPGARKFAKVSRTGGSTGTPTKVGYDGRIPEEVYSWRQQEWFGVHPWDHHAYVWRDTRGTKIARFKNALMWWPTKHLKLDATFITDAAIEAFLSKYNRLKPRLLYGYVGAITQLAQYVVDHQKRVHIPKFVWVTSAPLSAIQRDLISRAFTAPVCDQYGSCELRGIAQQCPELKGLHVNVEHVYIEFVDENNRPVPKGEYGRTLVTNLEDTVFPLIRYENNDRGRWLTEPCSCGRSLPCIDSVKGRVSESFVLPSGKTINGEYLTTIFDSRPELVKGFRVVQHKDLSITIEYIPQGFEREIIETLHSFADRLGNEVLVDFKAVSEIPHDRGKLRFVVREVK